MEALDRVPVPVTLSPGLSMLALITDALSGRRRGAPERWRRSLRAAAMNTNAGTGNRSAAPGRLGRLHVAGDQGQQQGEVHQRGGAPAFAAHPGGGGIGLLRPGRPSRRTTQ
ncbi:hypothetical protein [Nonomuraea sp. B5E05]|uniref:hypothetical protein n=1 Tax=Nonomuraea sp. B5E05 TaxID=3153569 RepID=UPI0032613ECF